jgi:hypothetical protein
MLYDPKWEDLEYQGVSRRELIAWLETMPPDKRYDFSNSLICATAQFLKSKGVPWLDRIVRFGGPGDSRGRWLFEIVGRRPWTYGAALERARAAML